MSEEERSSLEHTVAVIETKVDSMVKDNAQRASWIKGLVLAVIVQVLFTAFTVGIKWSQVDRLISDVHDLSIAVYQSNKPQMPQR